MLYIFDMGGVVTTNASIDEKIAGHLGVNVEDFRKDSKDLFEKCSDGLIDTREFWRLYSERTGVKVTTDWFHWCFHPVLNEDTVRLIKKLKELGNRVVCGTNTISAHYFNHIERGDYAYFDQTYSSCAMGVSKPDTAFWKIILDAEEVEPKDAVFFDDKIENCRAAESMGIKAVHFTDAHKAAEEIGIGF